MAETEVEMGTDKETMVDKGESAERACAVCVVAVATKPD